MKKKILITLATGCLMAASLFTGCGIDDAATGKSSTEENVTAAIGHLTISVNPEIMISYNKDGRVTEVKGTNNDGKDIISSYDDYIGKYCGRVLTELVSEIHEAGYFVEEADGTQKQIVLELEAGSKMPDDDFLEELSGNIKQAVTKLDLTSNVVIRDNDDNYDDTDYGSNDDGISNYFDDKDYEDTDYGPDNDGVTDYDDTDYGPNNDGVTDYDDTDYGPNNDGVTDYDDTDYGPNNDGVTDYDDTDYGVNNDGVTDYTPPAVQTPVYSDSGYGDSGYGDSGYDD